MRALLLAMLVLGLLFAFAGPASAASAQDIYNDYAHDGHLKGPYTLSELNAYLLDATVHMYGNQAVLDELDALVKGLVAYWEDNPNATWDQVVKAVTGSSSGKPRKGFPFTGFELLLAGLGSFALISGGVVIRRTAK
jgi:hypothetical protein